MVNWTCQIFRRNLVHHLMVKRTENGGSQLWRHERNFLPTYTASNISRYISLNRFSYLISNNIPTSYINILGYLSTYTKQCGYSFALYCLFFCFPKTAEIYSFSLSICVSPLNCITPYSPFFRPCAEDWSVLEIILHSRSNKTSPLIFRAFRIWHPSRRRWASWNNSVTRSITLLHCLSLLLLFLLMDCCSLLLGPVLFPFIS